MGMRQKHSSAEAPAFWVVVEDHQAKVFAVFGPLSEEGEWTAMVRVAQEQGSELTTSTVASEADSGEMALRLAEHGFKKSELAILKRLGLALANAP